MCVCFWAMQTTNDLDHLQQWLSILYSPVGSSTGNTPQLQQEAQRALFHAQQQPSAWQWPAALLAESVNRFFFVSVQQRPRRTVVDAPSLFSPVHHLSRTRHCASSALTLWPLK